MVGRARLLIAYDPRAWSIPILFPDVRYRTDGNPVCLLQTLMNYKTATSLCYEMTTSLGPVTSQSAGKLILIALLIAASGLVNAQVSLVDAPENASAKRYGAGWTCDRGYQEVDGACAAVKVPANAYPTNALYGSAWKCSRGFRKANEACLPIVVPPNAYLKFSGDEWKCHRGYRTVDETCIAIRVPVNGFLTRSLCV